MGGAEWQKALFAFNVLEHSCNALDVVSYNAVLQALYSHPIGNRLFEQGLAKGFFDGLYWKGDNFLDLRNFSPGASWIALKRHLNAMVHSGNNKGTRMKLITGWGRHKEAWSSSDLKQFICHKLNNQRVPWRTVNKGLLSVDIGDWAPQMP